jgi:hypothetical protein
MQVTLEGHGWDASYTRGTSSLVFFWFLQAGCLLPFLWPFLFVNKPIEWATQGRFWFPEHQWPCPGTCWEQESALGGHSLVHEGLQFSPRIVVCRAKSQGCDLSQAGSQVQPCIYPKQSSTPWKYNAHEFRACVHEWVIFSRFLMQGMNPAHSFIKPHLFQKFPTVS